MTAEGYTVHVVDDDAAVRKSLGRLLRIAGYTTRLYDSPHAALAVVPELEDGCLLLDVRMPSMTGLELLDALREAGVTLPVIVMTGLGDVQTAIRAMKGGAAEYLEKPFTEDALFVAIAACAERVEEQLPSLHSPEIDEARTRLAELSPRERQVLVALARGDAQKVIAYDLGISVRTVEVHRARMLRRLGIANLALAIRLVAIDDLAKQGHAGPDTSIGYIMTTKFDNHIGVVP
jgi:two-component system response regulator FixJ